MLLSLVFPFSLMCVQQKINFLYFPFKKECNFPKRDILARFSSIIGVSFGKLFNSENVMLCWLFGGDGSGGGSGKRKTISTFEISSKEKLLSGKFDRVVGG